MPPRRSRRRRRRISRKLLIWIGGAAGAALLLPALVVGGLIAAIDPDSYKAQLEASLRSVTGRELVIHGPLSVSVSASLSPKLEAEDVTLANMQGGSRADMVRIERMTIELTPMALLTGQLVVSRIALQRPDVLIETDAEGAGNWRYTGAPRGEDEDERPALALRTVHVRDGRLTWRDGRTGRSAVFDIRRISATSQTPESPVAISAELLFGRQRIGLQAQTGPLARLAAASSRTPWGLFATLESAGAKLTVTGALTRPDEARGYSLRLDGAVPQLANLSWISGWKLPPLSGLTFSARLLDTGGDYPDISGVTVQSGFASLDKVAPGFTLESLRIEMPRMSEPVVVQVEGSYASAPVRISGLFGAPALLMPFAPPGQGYPVDVKLEAAGASMAVRGAIAEPSKGQGMDIALGARIPDLSQLGALAGLRLPALKSIAFSARLADGKGGYRNELAVKDLVLTMPQGDVAGEAGLAWRERPGLRLALKSGAIDADGLAAAWQAAQRGEPGGAARAWRTDDAMAPLTLPPLLSGGRKSVIPDEMLPFDLLGLADADLRVAIGQLRAGGITYKDLTASLVLSEGRLVVNPIAAELPGGRGELRLGIAPRGAAPAVSLAVQTRGMDLGAVLPSWGVPALVSGRLDLDADLRATGGSWHALAGSLAGRVTAAVTNGEIDDAALGPLIPAVLQALGPGVPRAEAAAALRCLSLRAGIAAGVANLEQASIDSGRLAIDGSGTMDLGAETMALLLRPALRGPGAAEAVPMRAEGGWLEPRVTQDAAAGRVALTSGEACTPAYAAPRRSRE